ncbi:MAG: hypothetical protein B7Z78_04255 [Rhodospirillales bacterium 20-60-12]|nr:MAG: hypothetical protein B7Z78_04255 [Rhodospirillales bacterium 20-60-12]
MRIGYRILFSARYGQARHIALKSQRMRYFDMSSKLLLGAMLIAARSSPAAAQSLPPIIDPISHLTLAPVLCEKGFQEVSPRNTAKMWYGCAAHRLLSLLGACLNQGRGREIYDDLGVHEKYTLLEMEQR